MKKITKKKVLPSICGKNFIKWLNKWAVTLIKYSGPFFTKKTLKYWAQNEINTMHQGEDDADYKW